MTPESNQTSLPATGHLSPVEHALVLLMRAVLTAEEQQLLTVFAAITEPRIRQALLDVAAAATNVTAPTSDLSTTVAIDDISLQRVRRALLWHCSGKPGDYS